jgi:ribulose-bisphosphate carboxylase large chain
LFGQLARLGGADATVFPNFGGRFSFTREACAQIAEFARTPMGGLRPIFPTPGGGMGLDRIPEMARLYGRDVIYLIGAGLFREADLAGACRRFRKTVDASTP